MTTLTTEQRRALALVAAAGPLGVPEAMLSQVHGIGEATLAGLSRTGLINVVPQLVKAWRPTDDAGAGSVNRCGTTGNDDRD